ncbi:hypothetical protein INR49_026713 [Caranx melampygus]|nr:hypothetical protein INR49_026713 [Caranx melampygus]
MMAAEVWDCCEKRELPYCYRFQASVKPKLPPGTMMHQHGSVIIQIWDVPEQAPPDANVIESNTHPATRQRMPHVVCITQEKHACKRHSAVLSCI